MKRQVTMAALLLPATLAGSVAAQVISIRAMTVCPGPILNIPRIDLPGPRIVPVMPMPEIMPMTPAPWVAPVRQAPGIMPIMPAPRIAPFTPRPYILPIEWAALRVQLSAPAKNGSVKDAVKARESLENLFDGRLMPEPKGEVMQPAGGSPVRPSRRIGLPEQELENEIGVAAYPEK